MTKDEIVRNLEIAHEGAVIARGLESDVIADRARQERDNYGLKGLIETPFFPDERPRYTQPQFDALTDEEKEQRIDEGFQYRQKRRLADGIKDLSSKFDENTKDSPLTNIANAKEIVENASESNRALLESYAPMARYNQYIKELSDPDTKLSIEDEGELKKIASVTASKKQRDVLKGYSESLREIGAKLAGYLPSEIVSEDELKAGVEELKERTSKMLKSRFGEDYEAKATTAVREALRSLVSSGNPDKEKMAASLYLRAEKGYGLGSQDFVKRYT